VSEGRQKWEYVVVGAGAIGGTVGARLVRDGHAVLFCDASAEHVAAMEAGGLQIKGPVEEFVVPAPAVVPSELPQRLGRVLLAVKAQHTEVALAEIAPQLAPDGFVVSLQNGLNEPMIAAAVGSERTIGAFVNFGADYLAPGRIFFGGHGAFFIGELDGRPSERVESLVADIAHAQATTNIFGYLWSKLAYGAILSATAVSDLTMAAALEEPQYRRLFVGLAAEVLGQAEAPPEPFDGFDPADLHGSITRLADFNRLSGKTHSGIYRDLAVRRRPSEVEALLGSLDGRLLQRTRELIRDIEAGRRRCERNNLDLLARAAAVRGREAR
jgi:2-dehydropantoate 2-reductase